VVGLVAIAMSGMGLLVGGIGVMNIMLVSVTERTREIGVRKALGARRRDIIGQFLTESVALTGAGGVLGIVIAYPGMIDQAQDEVRAVLRISRRVPFNGVDTFSITTAEQMIEQFHSVTATVALVMVILSSIGLLVGGIGVMNIMLVSVTERTREIGVRKAIGARKSDIIVQFLTEAVVLTVMGGVLGLLLGWSISRAAGLIFPNLPTAVPLWAAASGVAVSVGVGLFFGIWPASRAARLDPVEALRHE
jgi:putative ABC transport system permease protein